MSEIICLGTEPQILGELEKIGPSGIEIWSNLIQENDLNVLAIVKKRGAEGAGFYSPRDTNKHLVVSKEGYFFWFPCWSRLTSRQGWLRAIAGNYSQSPDKAEELWKELLNLIISSLERKKPKTVVSFDEILGLVRTKLKKEIRLENRDLIISSPNWSSRYITLHETKGFPVHLHKIRHPETEKIKSMPPNLQPWEYFPIEWVVSLLEEVTNDFSGILSPKFDDYPGRLDIVTLGDYEKLHKSLKSLGLSSINSALAQLNLSVFAEQKQPTLDRRVNVLLQALGLTKPRDSYALYLENKIRNLPEEGLHNNVRKILEERFIEIYISWISAFSFAHGIGRDEYLELLNKGQSIEHRFDPSFGSILDFISKHHLRMKDTDYNHNILVSFSSRIASLMSDNCLYMLKALNMILNHFSHTNRPLDEGRKNELLIWLNKVSWNDKWDALNLSRKIYDFIERLYDVNDEYNSARVPELMEVQSIIEDSVSRRALLKSLRNDSSPCYINIDRENRPREFGAYANKSHRKPPQLQIGDRVMILASTNPVLIRPWIKPM